MEKLPIRIPSKDSKPIRQEGKFTIYQSPNGTQFKTFTVDENSFRNRALDVEEKTDAIQKPKEKLKLVDKKELKPVPHWTVQGYGDPKKSVITADNRSKQQREYDDKKTKEWLAAEHKKDIDQKVTNYMLLPAAIGIAQFTPAAPYVNAALFAHGASGLHNQYQNGTLGMNMETVGNTLSMVPFTPKVLRTTGGIAGKVINTAIDSRPMMGLYRNFKPARDWRLGLEFDRTLGHSYSSKMPYLYTESSKITGVPTQSGFSGTPYKMFDPRQLHKDMVFNTQTPGGYQLKSLMYGNPLEKQLSKAGTLNVNNIIAYANKTSLMEKQIMTEVLESNFAGQKTINYADFKKAIQDRLITYNRNHNVQSALPNNISTDYLKIYGGNRLGLINMVQKVPDGAGGHTITYRQNVPVTFNQFTFESPRISMGNNKHYTGSPLGHSRTYTLLNEPDILYVMESQSDWAQNLSKLKGNLTLDERINRFRKSIQRIDEEIASYNRALEEGILPNGRPIQMQYEVDDVLDMIKEFERRKQEFNSKIFDLQIALDPTYYQQRYLQQNYLQRQLQENLRYAAEQGHTKMRYPTRESAVKIEGYTPAKMPSGWSDEVLQFTKTNPKSPYTSEIYELSKKLEGVTDKTKIAEIRSQLKRAKAIEQRWLNSEVTYPLKYETILDKYSDFPNLYKRLFKNQEVRTVTDPLGNTWYEIDIPKNYLNMEWQYKSGGKLIKKHTQYGK